MPIEIKDLPPPDPNGYDVEYFIHVGLRCPRCNGVTGTSNPQTIGAAMMRLDLESMCEHCRVPLHGKPKPRQPGEQPMPTTPQVAPTDPSRVLAVNTMPNREQRRRLEAMEKARRQGEAAARRDEEGAKKLLSKGGS